MSTAVRKIPQTIVEDVQNGGAKSLVAWALRLGDIKSEDDSLVLGPEQMKAAFDALPTEDQQVLLRTKVLCLVFVVCFICCVRLYEVFCVRVDSEFLAKGGGAGGRK